jgi:hypothetical protein
LDHEGAKQRRSARSAKGAKVVSGWNVSADELRAPLEYELNCLAASAVCVLTLLYTMIDTLHAPDVAHPTFGNVLEEMQVLAIGSMIADGCISADKLHATILAFASVNEGVGVFPVIGVTVFFALRAGEQEDVWLALRGANATLSLPAILCV